MAKPERLEDLGRIREKLEYLFAESEAFEAGNFHDEKFMHEYQDEDNLDSLRRSLRGLSEILSECVIIARGNYDE